MNLGWEIGPSVGFFARFILIDLCIDWTLYCKSVTVLWWESTDQSQGAIHLVLAHMFQKFCRVQKPFD